MSQPITHETNPPTLRTTGDDQTIRDYLAAFAAALNAGDARTIGGMWSLPALMVTKDGTSRALTQRSDVEAVFVGAKEAYTSRGIAEARPEIRSVLWATPAVALVDVRWPYFDASGREFGSESSVYMLRRVGGQVQTCAILMRGEELRGDSTRPSKAKLS